jgi:hypothetical protein
MPTVSVYVPDELYAKLLASKERPSALVGRLIKEYLAKLGTPEAFETLTIKLWDRDIHMLFDRSKPKNEQFVMQSENLKEIEAYIRKQRKSAQ